MWHQLRAGRYSEEARSALQDLTVSLRSLQGSLRSDVAQATTQYLLWAEKAEAQLVSLYSSDDVVGRLHSERYWRIRGLDDASMRPLPLIEAELANQMAFLDSLDEQLQHFGGMLSPLPEERLVVCDTNVLIHGKLFHEVAWPILFEERKVRLILPLVVIDELDRLKDRGIREAGGVLKALDSRLRVGAAMSRVELRANVSLQLVDEPLEHLRLRGQDDEIVRQALYFKTFASNRLTVITRDRGMRVRCEAASLACKMLPLELERKHFANG